MEKSVADIQVIVFGNGGDRGNSDPRSNDGGLNDKYYNQHQDITNVPRKKKR